MDILISGAGISGCASALALCQAGHTVHVYERRQRLAHGGAGLVMWPNACFVLEQLGLLDVLRTRGGRVRQMRRISRAGQTLGSLPTAPIEEALGFPSLAVLRADLHGVLRDAAESAGAAIHPSVATVGFVDDGEAVRVRLSDGGEARADLILGAEGRMRSPSRAHVAGDATPRYQGFVNWVGVVQSTAPLFEPGVVLDMWGQGERFGVVPLSDTRAYFAGAAAREDPIPTRGSLLDEMRRRFASWPAPVPRLLDSLEEGSLREVLVYDHDPLQTWHRRNLLLVGDAAHAALPTSGQGACQALEDAWHLARCIERSQDPSRIAAELVERRSSKTTAIITAGRRLARSLFEPDAEACRARDAEARRTDYGAMASGIAKLWGAGLPASDRPQPSPT